MDYSAADYKGSDCPNSGHEQPDSDRDSLNSGLEMSDSDSEWTPPFLATDTDTTPVPYGDLHSISPFVATPQVLF